MKFEENLRWWVDWLGQLTENDPTVNHFHYFALNIKHTLGHWLPDVLYVFNAINGRLSFGVYAKKANFFYRVGNALLILKSIMELCCFSTVQKLVVWSL